MEDIKILLNVDTVGYSYKPSKYTAVISNRCRCKEALVTISPEELLKRIQDGYTYTPGAIGGTRAEHKAEREKAKQERRSTSLEPYWISQQVIVADIDNDKTVIDEETGAGKKACIDYPLSPEEALQACREFGLEPYAILKTFSYTEEHEKFRVILILNETLTDFAETYDLINRFTGLFNVTLRKKYEKLAPELARDPELVCCDESIEPVKFIFGCKPNGILFHSGSLTSKEQLKALPETFSKVFKTENNKKDASEGSRMPLEGFASSDGDNSSTRHKEGSRAQNLSLDTLEQRLKQDIKSFDLVGYIERTTGSTMDAHGKINPCPICKHNGCLQVTGSVWSCHSDKHPMNPRPRPGQKKPGGTIIDYLMQKDKLSLHEAFDKFKFEIIGEDPEEWKKAFKEKKQAEEGFTNEELEALVTSFNEWNPDEPHEAQETHEAQEVDAMTEEAYSPENMQEPFKPGAENPKKDKPVLKLQSVAEYLHKGSYDEDINFLKQFSGRKMGLHPDIDKYLTLYPGLAALGGQASLGKTTFASNMVLELLKRKEHVLYFALEQRPDEIITKNISKFIYEQNPRTRVDNLQLNKGKRDLEISEAISALEELTENYHVIECDFETTAKDIIEIVEAYMKQEPGVKPIVIVDYLQLIAPPTETTSGMRETVDENLKALKRMQKKHGLFVIVISSFNRSSNYEPISYESFKETSMIESTCDYVWGLQLAIQDYDNESFYIRRGSKQGRYKRDDFEKKKMLQTEQAKVPKTVQFISLKNRKGKQFFKANFLYYPAHDFFTPCFDELRFNEPEEDALALLDEL